MGTHQFDLFCNSNIFRSSAFSALRPTDFTSTSLLRPKLYFDMYVSTNKKSRFDKRSKYRGRSTEKAEDIKMVEVKKRSNWCVPKTCRLWARKIKITILIGSSNFYISKQVLTKLKIYKKIKIYKKKKSFFYCRLS